MEDDFEFISLFSDEEGYGSMNEIVKDRLYLGDLFTAMSSKVKSKHSITHIVSVGPDYPSTGPEHLVVSVDDEAHENLLQHLNTACQFIQKALDSNGRVLVHCMMGVSRSPTVVAAYLMKTQGMTVSQAIRTIKHQRPQIHPNAGFMEQLDIFAKCNYDTSDTNPVYASWLAEQALLLDMSFSRPRKLTLSTIIPEKLFVSRFVTFSSHFHPVQVYCSCNQRFSSRPGASRVAR
ncbi:phosphatases II [Mycena pura]|uniref:protein-tyrosine-phosphatase n=1 Tax=Mycena pura TaxID=153505 RepID=A0AAD6YMY1_9AGAR|nr:phosphatases II [Mycena pura]